MSEIIKPTAELLNDVALLIEQSKQKVAVAVNAEMTLLSKLYTHCADN
jgi:hypothetical protein